MYGKWFISFDRTFTTEAIKPTRKLIKMLEQRRAQLSYQWPESEPLPSLSKNFQTLKRFAQQFPNVNGRKISEHFLIVLDFEKLYARDFWKIEDRMKASCIHLYLLLQKFYSLIHATEALFVKKRNVISKNFAIFETLNIELLKLLKQMSQFLLQKKFNQEERLISNFFNNFIAFLGEGKWQKKFEKFHFPKILTHTILTNQIQNQDEISWMSDEEMSPEGQQNHEQCPDLSNENIQEKNIERERNKDSIITNNTIPLRQVILRQQSSSISTVKNRCIKSTCRSKTVKRTSPHKQMHLDLIEEIIKQTTNEPDEERCQIQGLKTKIKIKATQKVIERNNIANQLDRESLKKKKKIQIETGKIVDPWSILADSVAQKIVLKKVQRIISE